MNEQSENPDAEKKRGLLKRALNKIITIIKQKDTPHRIALGMALGIFIGILPIMGIQMTVVALIALPLRGNLKAALAGVWISNPVTFIPMYWRYYQFGLIFYPSRALTWGEFVSVIKVASDWSWSHMSESTANILELGVDILVPMWTGATILAVAFGVPTYFVTRSWVVRYRARRARKKRAARAS
jgi:uncharacterized protein (DUF2062 family)